MKTNKKPDLLKYDNKRHIWYHEDPQEARRRRYALLKLMEERDAELERREAEAKAAGKCEKCGMRKPYATYHGRCQNIYCTNIL